jgi:hypothetical protein
VGRRVVLSCAAFLAAGGAIAWGVWTDAREARLAELLRRTDAAETALSYRGVKRIGAGEDPLRLRYASSGGERRVEFLGGAPRFPGRAGRAPALEGLSFFLRPEPGPGRRTERDRQLTLRNYELKAAGVGRIAGRDAEFWELHPRHEGRPSYRLGIDAERRLSLSFEMRRDGASVFSTSFEEIEFDAPSAAEPVAGPGPGRRGPKWLKVDREASTPERLSEAAGFPVWRPAWLPPGFEPRGAEVIRLRPDLSPELREAVARLSHLPLPETGTTLVKATYTDGLAFLAYIQVPAASELWGFVKRFVPAGSPEGPGGRLVARKFPDRGGAAYLLELEGSVLFVAGNAAPVEMETMIRTFERR